MSTPVKLRSLTVDEGRALERIRDRSSDPVTRRRAMILLAADTGLTPLQLQQQRLGHATYIRKILHAFNERGLASVRGQNKGQKPLKFDAAVQKQIVDVVVTPPDHLGLPFGQWSLEKLREYLIDQGIIESISIPHLRWLLHKNKISYQQSKTWKQSPDPEFDAKKRRIRRLYDAPPKANRRVICFDEFGPLEIRPHAGASWHPHKQPVRLPATYTRTHGTRYLLAAYDMHADHLWGWQRPNQRWPQVLAFFKAMRKRYPKNVHLYIILDNRGSHKKAEIKNWAKQNRVTLVFTPTYASWLNRIEAHFAALKKFALRGRTFMDHEEQGQAIQAYLRYRNKHNIKGQSDHRDQRVNLI